MEEKDQRLRELLGQTNQIKQDSNGQEVAKNDKEVETFSESNEKGTTSFELQENSEKTKINKEGFYFRENGESLSDRDCIKSCKDEQSRDIIENGRLGSYDEYGNYVLTPAIRQELTTMPKLVYNVATKDTKTIYDLRSAIPLFGDIFFRLKINKYEAVLLLVENVVREAGQYVEVYEEVVDSLAFGEKEPMSMETIFIIFNITEDSGDFGRKMAEGFEFDNILLRKTYLSFVAQKFNQITGEQELQDFEEMLKILQNGGEYGKKVLICFAKRIKDRMNIFDIQDEQYYARSLNQILLASLDIATTEQDKENEENFATYKKVINVRNRRTKELVKNVENQLDEQEIKQIVIDAKQAFLEHNQEGLSQVTLQYMDKLSISRQGGEKSEIKNQKHTLDKPIMKQLIAKKKQEKKELEGLSKEQKIQKILNKDSKKEQKPVKKVAPSKAQKAKAKSKAKGKGKAKGKKPSKKKPSKPQKKSASKAKKPSGKPKAKKLSSKKSAGKKKSSTPKKEEKKKTIFFAKEYMLLLTALGLDKVTHNFNYTTSVNQNKVVEKVKVQNKTAENSQKVAPKQNQQKVENTKDIKKEFISFVGIDRNIENKDRILDPEILQAENNNIKNTPIVNVNFDKNVKINNEFVAKKRMEQQILKKQVKIEIKSSINTLNKQSKVEIVQQTAQQNSSSLGTKKVDDLNKGMGR